MIDQFWLYLLAVSLASTLCAAAGPDLPRRVVDARWPEALGNHRALVRVREATGAVWARIPWRRRDPSPEKKNVVVVDAETGKEVRNRVVMEANRECGDVVFEPATAPGDYFVYYLPYSHDPKRWRYRTEYAALESTADTAWIERHRPRWKTLPEAEVVEFQTWSEFHRLDPMEVIATKAETDALVAEHNSRPYLLFPEDRTRPIRMKDNLPLCWVRRGPTDEFRGQAQRGEFYVFQVGVYAARQAIDGLAVEFGDLRSAPGCKIPASAFRGTNVSGTDWLGRAMTKNVSVAKGKVQALWFGVQLPKALPIGRYEGNLVIRVQGADDSAVKLSLDVSEDVLEDAGVGELWRMARLKWLDSTIGLDDEVAAPFTPLRVEGRTIRCLGRELRIGDTGLPESIRSRYPLTVDRVDAEPREILARPAVFLVETAEGEVAWRHAAPKFVETKPGRVTWESSSRAEPMSMHCRATMEPDGHVDYRVQIEATQAIAVRDLRLEIPFRADVAEYMMGMARKGGVRPKEWRWSWDVRQVNHMAWIGDVNAGLHCKLKGPTDAWNISSLHATGIPASWGNDGKGGARLTEEGDAVVLRAYSGPREIQAGQTVEFRFTLLITPFKPLNPDHWRQRYYHYYAKVVPVEQVASTGATIINCHHGNDLNPHINYPFLQNDKLTAYVRDAHAKGIKVKIYYTVRELCNFVAELWALRSLGHEVFTGGGGGGHSWLREHLVSDYGAAWHQALPNGEVDAAIRTVGLSRWHNYYLEGLSWLIRNVGIDGLYLDGIGYDREIMKRVRTVMDRARPGCLIDFHSGNEFRYQGRRVSPACKYLEHFPYIDSLWFGEGYDYDERPDYWLVEISGIPYGLFGEMLQRGGNPWRGMVYGMTNRLGWGGDPRAIWKVWDEFGIDEARMIGYWDPSCPVKTKRDDALATVYVKEGKTLVSLASWAKEPVTCRLDIDWQALGLSAKKVSLFAPAVESFQMAALFRPSDDIPLAPARGWLLIIDEEPHDVPAAKAFDAYEGRTLLLEDRLDRDDLAGEWKVSLSAQANASLEQRDGCLAIEQLANCFAFAERPVPPGTTLVECQAFTGTDRGASWGPGLALVWADKAFRINARAEGRFGADDGRGQWFGGISSPNTWCHLRIRIEPDEVIAEMSPGGRLWYPVKALPRKHFKGNPVAVRIGKMSPGCKAEDYRLTGPHGACAIKALRVFGE